MNIINKFHVIEFNRESGHDPSNTLKIDGKKINGIRNVKIEYGLDNPLPIVTIEFLAKEVKGKARGGNLILKEKR